MKHLSKHNYLVQGICTAVVVSQLVSCGTWSGPTGPDGAKGDAGSVGTSGGAGIPGINGATGPTGPQGPAGQSCSAISLRGNQRFFYGYATNTTGNSGALAYEILVDGSPITQSSGLATSAAGFDWRSVLPAYVLTTPTLTERINLNCINPSAPDDPPNCTANPSFGIHLNTNFNFTTGQTLPYDSTYGAEMDVTFDAFDSAQIAYTGNALRIIVFPSDNSTNYCSSGTTGFATLLRMPTTFTLTNVGTTTTTPCFYVENVDLIPVCAPD